MRAYDALLSGGFRSAELDIFPNDDKDDVPTLARLGDSVPEPDVHVSLEGVRQGGTLGVSILGVLAGIPSLRTWRTRVDTRRQSVTIGEPRGACSATFEGNLSLAWV